MTKYSVHVYDGTTVVKVYQDGIKVDEWSVADPEFSGVSVPPGATTEVFDHRDGQ